MSSNPYARRPDFPIPISTSTAPPVWCASAWKQRRIPPNGSVAATQRPRFHGGDHTSRTGHDILVADATAAPPRRWSLCSPSSLSQCSSSGRRASACSCARWRTGYVARAPRTRARGTPRVGRPPAARSRPNRPRPPPDHVRILHDPPPDVEPHHRARRPVSRRDAARTAATRDRGSSPSPRTCRTSECVRLEPAGHAVPAPVSSGSVPAFETRVRRTPWTAVHDAVDSHFGACGGDRHARSRHCGDHRRAPLPSASPTRAGRRTRHARRSPRSLRRRPREPRPRRPFRGPRRSSSPTPTGNGTVTVSTPFTLTLATTNNAVLGQCRHRQRANALYRELSSPGRRSNRSPATGSLTVRLGNTAAIQISVNGTPLQLPGVGKTANVRFATAT